jgi:hypothetical protein
LPERMEREVHINHLFERPRKRWKESVEIYNLGTDCGHLHWIDLPVDCVLWQALDSAYWNRCLLPQKFVSLVTEMVFSPVTSVPDVIRTGTCKCRFTQSFAQIREVNV